MMLVETSVFASHVQLQIEGIMQSKPIGLCQKPVAFMNPRPSCPDYLEDAKCDQVKLSIPYAGVSVDCLVMFQATQPSNPPDFIFADTRFIVPLDKITELNNWNYHRPRALLKTLKQLLHHYKEKQISLLEGHYYVHQDYLSLASTGKYFENDIEIFVPSNNRSPISFVFRLKPNFQKIPAAYFKNTDARNYPLLLITFPSIDKTKRNFKLYFSNDLENALGLAVHFKLPGYHSTMTLGHYVQNIEIDLTKKAEAVVSNYEMRKQYIATFASHLENCIIEYDSKLFQKFSFIAEDSEYYIVVEITLPPMYPAVKPMLTFRSLYYSYEGIPTSVVMNAYQYSPDWPLDRVFTETIKYVREYAALFPNDSIPFQ